MGVTKIGNGIYTDAVLLFLGTASYKKGGVDFQSQCHNNIESYQHSLKKSRGFLFRRFEFLAHFGTILFLHFPASKIVLPLPILEVT